ncbi:ABC transporter ATP-binding protein [Corynebacterium heidelbergense]|uniref:ABC transporter ATP-binding protein n=1 Tax=Corynebacterium heidelbergense TaxID=2055947 RepID=A0A364VE00_9CORY|nr:ABC transporter ATP-binding protein [Corynebacterium heidelbergense]RAV34848.1 ABC transporter ATP-binding protein [Corynebacterium heidelbergense]
MRHPIWHLAAQRPALLGTVALLAVIVPVFAVALPAFAGGAVDGQRGAIAGLIIAASARFLTHGLRRYLAGTLSLHIQHDLRMRVLQALQRLDAAAANRVRVGQVVSRTISDLSSIQSMVALVPLLASSAVEIALIFAALVWISVPIAVIVAVQVPIVAAVAVISRRKLYAATWFAQQASADIASQVEETVTGVRVVKAFAQERREIATFTQRARALFAERMRVGRLTAHSQPSLGAIPNVALVVTIVVGGWLATQGVITIGEFLATSTYIALLARLTRMTSRMLVSVYLSRSAVDRVVELMTTAPRPEGTVRLDGAAYGVRGTVGDRLEVDIRPGETVAFTGPAGSGKTYLAQALAGVDVAAARDLRVVPGQGAGVASSAPGITAAEATAPGIALLDVVQENRPTVVLDEAFLYSTSIAENIRCGYPATDAQVRHAAQIACAVDFIEQLGGFDTVVGERGLTLSGGQRQRIAIARAVVRNPCFLILDDATSAIDAATEARIVANLRAERGKGDLTTVIFSHRPSTLALAERVIPLPAPPTAELWPDVAPEAPATGANPPPKALTLTLPPAAEPPRISQYTAPFGLASLMRMIPGLLAAVVVTLLLTVLADVGLPSFVRHAIDAGVAHGDMTIVWWTAAAALVVVVVSWGAQVANTILTTRAGERLLYALRVRTYRHLNSLGMDWFEANASGRIMTRMTTDIDTLSSFLQTGLSQAIVSFSVLVGVLAMLVVTDLRLTAVVAVFVPLIAVASWQFRRVSARLYRAARAQVSTVNASFQEAMTGLVTGQAYGYAPAVEQRIRRDSAEYRRLRCRAQAAVSVFFPGISWLTELAQAAVLATGTDMIAHGQVSQGAVVAFSLYLTQFFGPVQQLSQIYDSFQQANVSLGRIGELLGERPSITSPPTATNAPGSVVPPLTGSAGPVRLDAVSFAYGRGNRGPVDSAEHDLRAVSVNFTGTTAVVGHTGAGKSTLLKLIDRWYDPTAGEIRYRDQPITAIPVQTWRRSIGYVPQEAHLFRGDVASNIAYGLPEATPEQIEDAVRRIGGIGVLSSIPGGFRAPVTERGTELSAGQRQIIALARAELLDPQVLLLDEATATLSEEVEHTVVAATKATAAGRTAIIVAHRLTTAQSADRIVVMKHGEIVEIGSHCELLEQGGPYAELWAAAHPGK